jgi:hypothetical protein
VPAGCPREPIRRLVSQDQAELQGFGEADVFEAVPVRGTSSPPGSPAWANATGLLRYFAALEDLAAAGVEECFAPISLLYAVADQEAAEWEGMVPFAKLCGPSRALREPAL